MVGQRVTQRMESLLVGCRLWMSLGLARLLGQTTISFVGVAVVQILPSRVWTSPVVEWRALAITLLRDVLEVLREASKLFEDLSTSNCCI